MTEVGFQVVVFARQNHHVKVGGRGKRLGLVQSHALSQTADLDVVRQVAHLALAGTVIERNRTDIGELVLLLVHCRHLALDRVDAVFVGDIHRTRREARLGHVSVRVVPVQVRIVGIGIDRESGIVGALADRIRP